MGTPSRVKGRTLGDGGSSGVDRDHGGLIKMCILKAYTLPIVLQCVTC